MKEEVLELYNHLLEYCKENKLMITKFNIQNNVFQELEITITDDIKEQIYSIKLPNEFQIRYLFSNSKNIHGIKLQNIIDVYIY